MNVWEISKNRFTLHLLGLELKNKINLEKPGCNNLGRFLWRKQRNNIIKKIAKPFKNIEQSKETTGRAAGKKERWDATGPWKGLKIRRGTVCKPVVPGGARGAMALPDFGRSVNPISTNLPRARGVDYAHEIILAPPDFQTFRRPWHGLLWLV